ncbi:hypothetical protein CHS0354_030795 [Potamilus streckersoni]|uniref:Uncharacterized protein n=1 Tax=Potamilus streckersoni TaxID=2493646 RepID=A0AAE0WCJ1_9BIVA|nr:hypothetical protein CHS0354_030795 [Potamilus streckersoni]
MACLTFIVSTKQCARQVALKLVACFMVIWQLAGIVCWLTGQSRRKMSRWNVQQNGQTGSTDHHITPHTTKQPANMKHFSASCWSLVKGMARHTSREASQQAEQ